MSSFFWNAGHLGWGVFALAVFSALWLLGADLVWRTKTIRVTRFAPVLAVGWLAGIGLIVWLACG